LGEFQGRCSAEWTTRRVVDPYHFARWESAGYFLHVLQRGSGTEADELQVIDYASRIAGIAIERDRSQSALALALEKITTNEQSLRLIVDSIPGQIAVMTAGGEVELLNRQILEYFGKTTEELKNWATNNTFHPDDLPRTINAWKRALETGQPFDF
jgi:PAS domain-containing protein